MQGRKRDLLKLHSAFPGRPLQFPSAATNTSTTLQTAAASPPAAAPPRAPRSSPAHPAPPAARPPLSRRLQPLRQPSPTSAPHPGAPALPIALRLGTAQCHQNFTQLLVHAHVCNRLRPPWAALARADLVLASRSLNLLAWAASPHRQG